MPAAVEPKIARYHLRRTLPPWKFQERIDETVAFCTRHAIEEVIWKIDTEEISHGLPTLDMIRAYLPALNESRQKLAGAGIAMSINPWVTQGMRDAGWDLRATFPDFEWLTDITGIQAKSQACPMGPAWRNWIADAFDLYASTGPNILWIEDDFRVHRHRPVTVACFCNRHIRTFSEKMGRPFTRESLAAELLRPGKPSPIRAQWFDHVGGVMSEVVELLADRIYSRHPRVQLGLMCSPPRVHATERRDWDRVARALKGPHKDVAIRPCMGNYSEANLRGLYSSRENVGSTLHCISQPLHACSEVENYPFTQFAKSHTFTRAQVLLSAVLRCPSITLNLFDHMGTPATTEEGFGKVLSDVRPMLEQVASTFPPAGLERGVQILHALHGPELRHLREGQTFPDLVPPEDPWAEILQSLGFAITWSPETVVALSGQTLRAFSNDIDALFSKAVLLDAAALATLADMVGRERTKELTGVTLNSVFDRRERITSIEALTDPDFGGPAGPNDPENAGRPERPARHITADQVGLTIQIADMTPAPGARVISQLVDADLNPHLPGFVLYQNSLGGRVAICPYDLAGVNYPWFVNWNRQRQLAAILDWLWQTTLPLKVEGGAYALPLRTDHAGGTTVAVMNLSLDTWEKIRLTLSFTKPPTTITRLHPDSTWKPVATHHFANNTLTIESESLPHAELAVFRIE